MNSTNLPQLLRDSYPLPISEEIAARLTLLADLLAWLAPNAARVGLTKYASPLDLTNHLVLPTLPLLMAVNQTPVNPLTLDFGPGCGAVGLTWALLSPTSRIVLADRRARVVQFIDLAIRRFNLDNCETLQGDLRRPPAQQAEGFALILLRAFAPGPEALQTVLPWLTPGGQVAFWHQPPAPQPPEALSEERIIATSVPSLALAIYRHGPA